LTVEMIAQSARARMIRPPMPVRSVMGGVLACGAGRVAGLGVGAIGLALNRYSGTF
jgi:hypothetical protein